MTITPACFSHKLLAAVCILSVTTLPVRAIDFTWDFGGGNNLWTNPLNWDLDSGTPDGADDRAIFNSNVGSGVANNVIDLGGIQVSGGIQFDTNSVASYTIGVLNTDTINLAITADSMDNDADIEMTATVQSDQTIAADLTLGDGAGQGNFNDQAELINRSTTNTLFITGDISSGDGVGDGAGGQGNNVRLAFRGPGLIDFSGNIEENAALTSAGGIDWFFFTGSNTTWSGSFTGSTNDYLNYIIRDNSTLTVTSALANSMGNGTVEIRYGVLNVNQDQTFANTLSLGNAGQGDGDAILNIAAGATVFLQTGLSYFADNPGQTGNQATIQGDGELQLFNASRTFTVNNNTNIPDITTPELTISADITDDNSTRDINVIGGGTLLLSGNNTHDRTTLQNAYTIAGSGTIFGTGDGTDAGNNDGAVILQQNNSGTATIYDGAVTLDINGQEVIFAENLILGQDANANVATIESISVIDSVGGGKVVLNGTRGGQDNNDIIYRDGTTQQNAMAIISADIEIRSGTVVTVEDGGDDVDLDITGVFGSDTNTRTVFKNGAGTLRLTNTQNAIGVVTIQDGRIVIPNFQVLGSDDVQLGANTLSGILEYTGGTTADDQQFRIGDNNASGATNRVGGGTIRNIGTGTLTLTNGAFNQTRASSTSARTVTFDGTSDIVVEGAIVDNNAAGGATIAITKDGANRVTLNGNNTYTGATQINAGTLAINGTNTTDITVNAGANLDGEGTTNGNITFSGTTHSITVDGSTAAVLGATGATSMVDVSALAADSFLVTLQGGSGIVEVLTYGSNGGSLVNDGDGINIWEVANPGALGSRAGFGDFNDDTINGVITLNTGIGDLFWTGGTDNQWDLATSNWELAMTPATFMQIDSVTFDETAAITGTIALQQDVTVTDMTFIFNDEVDSMVDYTLTNNTITLNGILNFDGSNDDTGTDADNDVTIQSIIAGSGSIYLGEIDGNDGTADPNGNVFRLEGNNTFTGGVTIAEGQLHLRNANGLGTGLVTLTDEGGGSNRDPRLSIDGNFTVGNDIFITDDGGLKEIRVDNFGAGTRSGILTGSIINNETGGTNFRFTVGENDSLEVDGVISGVGGVSQGGNAAGVLILDNAGNSFERGVAVLNGTTRVGSIGDIGVNSHAGSNKQAVGFILGDNTNTGTLEYTGASNEETNRQFNIGDNNVNAGRTGGAVIRNSSTGGGSLTFDNATFNLPRTAVEATSDRTITFDAAMGNIAVTGVIQNNTADATIAVVKDGNNALYLDGVNTYTGGTTVNAGTLGGTGTFASDITIDASATHTAARTGTSTMADAGTQIINANLSYGNGSTVVWDLVANSTSTGDFDQFDINGGTLSFDTSLNFNIEFGPDVNFNDGFWNSQLNQWLVWDTGGVETLPSTYTITNNVDSAWNGSDSGGVFQLSAGFGADPNGIWLVQTSVIPEPNTFGLMGLALAGFGWIVRRRRKKGTES